MSQQLVGLEGLPGLSKEFNTFIRTMRLFMRDEPHLNRLVRGVEHSDRLIAWAALDFLSDFNSTPPPLGQFTIEQLLGLGYISLARRGTAVSLLESVGILMTRNNLNFSDGGINISTDKTQYIQSWIDRFQSKYEQDKNRIKVSMNINMITGVAGAHSEYHFINQYYGVLY